MPLSEEEIAALQAKATQATELEAKLKDFESKAKGYDEVKADMLRYKDQLAKEQAAKDAAERERLEKQGEYKGLLEKAEAGLNLEKKKSEEAEALAQSYIRRSAFKDEARKAGVRDEAISDLSKLLNLDKLEIQRNGTEIEVKGVADLVAEAKKTRPYLFTESKAPGFDAGKGGTVKADEGPSLSELKAKDPQAFKEKLAAMVAAKP